MTDNEGFSESLSFPSTADQVAKADEFLETFLRKAGLPEDAWKDKKTKIYIFSADVFSPDNL